MTGQILKFTEKPIIDESIQEYEYHEYEPQARTNLNSAGEIVINIELQDLFSHPCESYLVFEGRRTKMTTLLTRMQTCQVRHWEWIRH